MTSLEIIAQRSVYALTRLGKGRLNGRGEVGAGTSLARKLRPRADRGVHPAARTGPGPRRRLFMALEHHHISLHSLCQRIVAFLWKMPFLILTVSDCYIRI